MNISHLHNNTIITTVTSVMTSCAGCGSDSLHEIEGDLTCIKCGLVSQERMIQDTIEYVTYADQASYQLDEDEEVMGTREVIRDHKLSRYQNSSISYLEKKFIDIKSRVEGMHVNDGVKGCAIRIIKETLEAHTDVIKGKKMLMMIALSLYYSGKYLRSGVDIKNICVQLGVDWKRVLAYSSDILPTWYNKPWYKRVQLFSHTDKLRRVVHELSFLDVDQVQKVKRIAEKLYGSVCHYPKFTSSKTNTVIFTCVYISCKVTGISIKKPTFCQEVGMSLQTLHNCETAIQQVLQSN